jgi:hypothetical protein
MKKAENSQYADNIKSLQIVSESLPTRCEVCHKSDYFDPRTGNCSRCNSINIPDADKSTSTIFDYIKTIPQNINFKRNGSDITISYPWWGPEHIFNLILLLIALPFVLTERTIGVIVLFLYLIWTILGIINRSVVIINDNGITVSDHPIPLRKKSVELENLNFIYINSYKGFSIYDRRRRFDLVAVLKNGAIIRLLSETEAKKDIIEFIKQIAEQRLGCSPDLLKVTSKKTSFWKGPMIGLTTGLLMGGILGAIMGLIITFSFGGVLNYGLVLGIILGLFGLWKGIESWDDMFVNDFLNQPKQLYSRLKKWI